MWRSAQGFLKVSTTLRNTRRYDALFFAPWQSPHEWQGLPIYKWFILENHRLMKDDCHTSLATRPHRYGADFKNCEIPNLVGLDNLINIGDNIAIKTSNSDERGK
jgi:hypothetical protein